MSRDIYILKAKVQNWYCLVFDNRFTKILGVIK